MRMTLFLNQQKEKFKIELFNSATEHK